MWHSDSSLSYGDNHIEYIHVWNQHMVHLKHMCTP